MSSVTQSRANHAGALRAGAIFVAIVVWLVGVRFTVTALPLPAALASAGALAPLVAAVVLQLALSIAQYLARSAGAAVARWPYYALVALDILINAIGILVDYGVAESPAGALLYMLRAIATAAGMWQALGALAIGALIAALPEQLARDAMKQRGAAHGAV